MRVAEFADKLIRPLVPPQPEPTEPKPRLYYEGVWHAGPFSTNRAIKRQQRRQLQRRLTEIRMKERRHDLVPQGRPRRLGHARARVPLGPAEGPRR